MRDYRKLGEGHRLGEYEAYKCLVPGDHLPQSEVESQQIVTIGLLP